MNQQQALAAITDALRKTLKDSSVSVSMETDFIEEGILDSLDGMVFLMELSMLTDKQFPENDLVDLGYFKVKTLIKHLGD